MAESSNTGALPSGYGSGKGSKITDAKGGGKIDVSKKGVSELGKAMSRNPFDKNNAAGKDPKVTNK
ncbi:hypothetical protein GOV11_04245 [Candidatus Woesearchaeota archaeon]|nr:hypothetical protein [Candidatus Woesearchaeota archaeon]